MEEPRITREKDQGERIVGKRKFQKDTGGTRSEQKNKSEKRKKSTGR